MKITFTVNGPPVPKARARKGKGDHWYTPPKTAAYEKLIHRHAFAALLNAGFTHPTVFDCEMWLRIYYPDNKIRDDDNVLKTVKDAMNTLAYGDDRQVRRCLVVSEIDAIRPRIEVMVREAKRNRRGERQAIE